MGLLAETDMHAFSSCPQLTLTPGPDDKGRLSTKRDSYLVLKLEGVVHVGKPVIGMGGNHHCLVVAYNGSSHSQGWARRRTVF